MFRPQPASEAPQDEINAPRITQASPARRRWVVAVVAVAIATVAAVLIARPWLWDDYMAGYRAGGTHVNPGFCQGDSGQRYADWCAAPDPLGVPPELTSYSRGFDDGWRDRFPRLWRTSLLREWFSTAGGD